MVAGKPCTIALKMKTKDQTGGTPLLQLVKRSGTQLDCGGQQERPNWPPHALVSHLHGAEAVCDGDGCSCGSSSSPTPALCVQGTCCC